MKTTNGFVKYTSNKKLLSGVTILKVTPGNLNQTLPAFPFFPLEMTCGGHSKGNIWQAFLNHLDDPLFSTNLLPTFIQSFPSSYLQLLIKPMYIVKT